jgi:large subunit ribosomal protein L29
MKNKDIKKMTTDELNKKVNLLKKDLFNIRFKKVNGQLQDTAKILTLKKNVAKILTKLNFKEN